MSCAISSAQAGHHSAGAGLTSRAEILDETLRRLPLRTPTLPPATTTNTLVVGRSRLAIVEPATPHRDEQDALLDELARMAADGRTPAVILVTHHHADHTGAVEALRQRFSIPVRAHALTAARIRFAVDETIEHGEVIDLGEGVALEALFTPGHAPGHLVYRERATGIAYAGDMVAGEGTILVDPDDAGDMAAYLRSLQALADMGPTALVPAHGPVIDRPTELIAHYIAHRTMREDKVLAAIATTDGSPDAVLASAYDDTPRLLWPLAERSLRAHVAKLVAEGRVELVRGRWRQSIHA